jgi:hypothetical protein
LGRITIGRLGQTWATLGAGPRRARWSKMPAVLGHEATETATGSDNACHTGVARGGAAMARGVALRRGLGRTAHRQSRMTGEELGDEKRRWWLCSPGE